ncbi:MAG: pepsin/retropepsin-like aspartic protease family protein [Myxococcota bacterium]|nr:pepsin/retropepsin-like aspartic protease family protein [Myxococcota bacterium]
MRRICAGVLAGCVSIVVAVASLGADASSPEAGSEPAAAALVGELPFEVIPGERNRIGINLAQEGRKPFLLFLDTGAQDTVLTPAAAKRNGVSIRRAKTSPYIRDTRLGVPLRFRVDTRWSDQSSGVGWEYGVLGGRFLAQFVVELDFEARKVRFYDPAKFSVPESVTAPDEAVIPSAFVANRPFVSLEIGGEKPLSALLDTGAPGTVLASGKALRKVGLDTSALPVYAIGQFTRGRTELQFQEKQRVGIGPFDLGELPMEVSPRGAFNVGGNTDSLIGYEIISQFKVRLDYRNERIWLKRREGVSPTFHGTDLRYGRDTGAYLISYPGTIRVQFVREGSLADAYGLRAGDSFPGAGGDALTAEAIAASMVAGEALRGRRPVGAGGAVPVEFSGVRGAVPLGEPLPSE